MGWKRENVGYLLIFPTSSQASTGVHKDGSRWVRVRNEIALKPGLAVMKQYFDPAQDSEVKVVGEEVKEYPKLEEFKDIFLRILRFKTYNEQFIIQEFVIVS